MPWPIHLNVKIPGNPQYSTADIPKVVGGINKESTRLACDFYNTALQTVVEISSTQAAEMSKLLENIFRSVNIAMVNELKILCHRMGNRHMGSDPGLQYQAIRFHAILPRDPGLVDTVFPLIHSTLLPKRGNMISPPSSLNWQARSTRQCRTM